MDTAQYALMAQVESRHWWFRARLAIVRSVLARYVPPGRGLDCSCGTGMTLQSLPRWVQFGADLHPLALRASAGRGLKRLFQADLRRLPVPDASLDVVTCLDTLEHIEEDTAALAEVFRVLRPGGFALFTVPAHPFLFSAHDRALHHVRRYRKAGLRDRVTGAGFAIRRLSYINCALFAPVALVRLLRPDRGETRSDTETVPFGPLNAVLYASFALERLPLRLINLPWGVSLLCLARKPGP